MQSIEDYKAQWEKLKPPRPPHGRRLLVPQIDIIAKEEPDRTWISVPVDNADLSQGYKDISFREFANAVNSTAHWLRDHLGLSSSSENAETTDGNEPAEFPVFAYTGPSDYGYGLFAAAAGKLGYQIIPFGRSIAAPGQSKIMAQKGCTVYLHAPGFENLVQEVQKINPMIRAICAPELSQLTRDTGVDVVEYRKTWEAARHDPWLVFHTSGTTGFPKVITYSQQQLSVADVVMALEDPIGDTTLQHYFGTRCYLPMPPMHYVSMFMTLGASVWARAVPVYGPGGIMPSPTIVKNILKYGSIDGAILVPALIDALCQDPESLSLLRKLQYIQYAGAPLSTATGNLLYPDVQIAPAIGSTDAGGYFIKLVNKTENWDYVALQPHTGAIMEHRVDNLYELVFVQHPNCTVQTVFEGRPDLPRFETKDLWTEHATKKGQWKLVGRSDDLIKLDSGFGVIVTPIEMSIAEHPLIKSALIGGHGRKKLAILIEPVTSKIDDIAIPESREAFLSAIHSHIDQINVSCHELAKLDSRLIVLAKPDKPWPLTMKDTPIRSQVLRLYMDEIEQAYSLI